MKSGFVHGVFAQLHLDLTGDLNRIALRFKGNPKISLVVRFENEPTKGVFLTSDSIPEVHAAIDYLDEHAKQRFDPIPDVPPSEALDV
jgi:hypothetical protein